VTVCGAENLIDGEGRMILLGCQVVIDGADEYDGGAGEGVYGLPNLLRYYHASNHS